jgi:hypothetical protein
MERRNLDMHMKVTTLAAAAVLIGSSAVGMAEMSSNNPNNPNSARKYAPGQLQKHPGQARVFAPGQRQKSPGQASEFAPGHEKNKATTGSGSMHR